jgi:hypothetical protein
MEIQLVKGEAPIQLERNAAWKFQCPFAGCTVLRSHPKKMRQHIIRDCVLNPNQPIDDDLEMEDGVQTDDETEMQPPPPAPPVPTPTLEEVIGPLFDTVQRTKGSLELCECLFMFQALLA